ncbi:hypothetical protein GCM10010149_36550 [Nonomuraea roseoviolacea subsp. roseoviolacea]|uniref:ABC-type Na+ efflux pump permease subunit n=1 Tax=Nonomuraea roseoviolacea subsp. carminata TaxID=160689 RepID=A0ABT1JVF6_9ACTN|nr:hypothetical protein [Nonomuraea roseoviolacea]MCP2345735.1 ABC-type Na+ efflux pump permease subunit [Nonomuraea roseoviolacea subsp. carminata]
MGRRTPLLLGLLGLALAALGVWLEVGRCNSTYPFELVAYVAGVVLIGGALILRYRPGVGFSILIALAVATVGFLGAALAFLASFARCFEF